MKKERTIKRAVYAGSFDPPTSGHLWMIEEAARLFQELWVAIGVNPGKKTTFSLEERMEMLRRSTRRFTNVRIDSSANMYLVRYAESVHADCIVRGIRNSEDYEYERAMRHTNSDLDASILTVFLMPPRGFAEVSSSLVKGLIGPEGWEDILAAYVPAPVFDRLLTSHDGLRTRLGRLCGRLGIERGQSDLYRFFMERYGEPARHYHTISHIAHCLRELNAVREQARDEAALEMAMWFHDAVYEPGRDDNEARSAELAGQMLGKAGVATERVRNIQDLIRATAHQQPAHSVDEHLIADIDLAVFGQLPTAFDEYEQAISDEYARLSEDQFSKGRSQFVRALLQRPAIYFEAYFREKYEAQARRNLERSLARWQGQ
jgi:pantetheine-phosphate adenylyltransferase